MTSRQLVRLCLTRRRVLALGAAATAGALVAPRPASAVLSIDITRATSSRCRSRCPISSAAAPPTPTPRAASPRSSPPTSSARGLFAPIDPAAYIEKIANIDAVPRFPDWRAINAQALVTGRVTRQSDGRLKAEFRLWDVFAGQQLAGQQYFTTPDNWRRIAHIISDAIYERLTGEKGYFDSRVVFVDETGPRERRVKRLAIMDQDGANVRYLTRGDDLVLTPRFSPSTPGDHLHGLRPGRSARLSAQHRDRPARDRRQFPRHDVLRRASRPTASASS